MDGEVGRQRRFPPFTVALIALNLAAFLLEMWIDTRTDFPLEQYGALSLSGLRHGYVWQLLTFQFLHAGWVHLLLNCWGIFVFTPPLEATLGKGRLATLYLFSGVAGGALQIFASILSPGRFGGPEVGVVGASAGLFGLIAAFTSIFPDARMTVLIFFVIPVRMTANRLLTLAGVLTALGIMFPNWLLGKHVAHAAHLGGLIAGLIMVRVFLWGYRR